MVRLWVAGRRVLHTGHIWAERYYKVLYKFTFFTLLYLYEHVQKMKHVRIVIENIDKSSDEARSTSCMSKRFVACKSTFVQFHQLKAVSRVSIRQWIHFKIGLFAFRARFSMLPWYLQYILLNHQLARQLKSSSIHQFQRPAVTSTFASQAISVCFVCNSFNPDLCSINTLGSFKSMPKTTLFLAAYGGNN